MKLTAGGQEDTMLTSVLVHLKANHNLDEKEGIEARYSTPKSNQEDALIKKNQATERRGDIKSSNSSTTESTVISSSQSHTRL